LDSFSYLRRDLSLRDHQLQLTERTLKNVVQASPGIVPDYSPCFQFAMDVHNTISNSEITGDGTSFLLTYPAEEVMWSVSDYDCERYHSAANRLEKLLNDTPGIIVKDPQELLSHVVHCCGNHECVHENNDSSYVYILVVPDDSGKIRLSFAKVDHPVEDRGSLINHLCSACQEDGIRLLGFILHPPGCLSTPPLGSCRFTVAYPTSDEGKFWKSQFPGGVTNGNEDFVVAKGPWPHSDTVVAANQQWRRIITLPQQQPAQIGQCLICFDEAPTYACSPCGHLGVCELCSQILPRDINGVRHCPVCRLPVDSFLKIFRAN
jgi:hypothetical protein